VGYYYAACKERVDLLDYFRCKSRDTKHSYRKGNRKAREWHASPMLLGRLSTSRGRLTKKHQHVRWCFLVSLAFTFLDKCKVELFAFEVGFDEFDFYGVAEAEFLASALATNFVLAGDVFEEVVAEGIETNEAFRF